MVRRPTQSDVARVAGVSRGAVSLALSGSPGVGEETRARIRTVADELGYVRNLGAAALAGQFESALGVVLPDLRNPFFESLVAEIQHRGVGIDRLPLFVTAQDDPEQEMMVMRKLHELRVAGIVAVSPVSASEHLVEMARALPIAVVGAEPVGAGVDVVHMDEDLAARLIADHVRDGGWKRVLHLSGMPGAGDVWVERRRRALAAVFTDVPFTHVTVRGDDIIRPVIEAQGLGDPEGLAIVAHNDLIAMDVVTAARSLGLVPGRDVAIIGFDDTHMAARPEFSLTSIHQDAGDLSQIALDMLRDRASDPSLPERESVLAPTLTVRSSS
ncbi:LacI family DNA-binding transcriptional regulator [Actinomycetaceae bacterium L2_0104]